MSRKKIVAATMTAAALGLAFAGYTATRANGTEELPRVRSLPLKADAGYRQNHQIEHNGAVFEWMDAAASLDRSHAPTTRSELPVMGKDLIAAAKEEEELEPVALEHASRVGTDFRGFGLAGGGGGGTPKGADDWGGGRYASNFGGFSGFSGMGSFGGGGGGSAPGTKGASGTNDTSGGQPHQDAPSSSNNTGDKPGSADPKSGDPTPTGPKTNPPTEEQNQNPPTEGPKDDSPHNGDHPGNGDHPNNGGHPNDGDHPPRGDHPNPPHSVPEPATLGLLGFGMIAAAALRRRRRS